VQPLGLNGTTNLLGLLVAARFHKRVMLVLHFRKRVVVASKKAEQQNISCKPQAARALIGMAAN
jgi:hypothetical protein